MSIYETIFKKYGLSPTQQEIIRVVGNGKTILEIGSSTGYMTSAFLENGCTVDVVEIDQKAARKIPHQARKVLNYSIENSKIEEYLSSDYDFIIMADVLEHLVNPHEVLRRLFKLARPQTKLLVSVPNVASWAMRKKLFFKGDFEYQDSGILDKTHLHFYTVATLPKILRESGWQTEQLIGTIKRAPGDMILQKIWLLGFLYHKLIRGWFTERFKNLTYEHFLIVARKLNG